MFQKYIDLYQFSLFFAVYRTNDDIFYIYICVLIALR